MIRGILVSLLCIVLVCACMFFVGAGALPVYFACWLLLLAIPAGALPVILALELTGRGGSLHTGYLRWLMVLMPIAALASTPILLGSHSLFPFHMTAFFLLRAIAILAVWTILCLFCLRPPEHGARMAFCSAALALHIVLATVFAFDWIGPFVSATLPADLGLLLISVQGVVAMAAAILLGGKFPPLSAPILTGFAAACICLNWQHFLIVWSADLPDEIGQYIHPLAALRWPSPADAAAITAMALLIAGSLWAWHPKRVRA